MARRKFTREFKVSAVRLVSEQGYSIPEAAKSLGVGEPATFRFFSSANRKQDPPGHTLDAWGEDELTESDPLEAHLPTAENAEDGYVPVKFQSRLTELGVFELWCLSQSADQKWKLEFSVREDAG